MTWECRKVQTEWTRKPKKNACRRTHRGCHEGEESPSMYLLVVSMTWTWSSWDQHMVYRWNCGVGDDSPCPPSTPALLRMLWWFHPHRTPAHAVMRRTPAHAVMVRRSASTRTPAHAVMVRHQSRALIVTRWRTWFDCEWNCQHNIENLHRPIHIAGWISGMGSLSS